MAQQTYVNPSLTINGTNTPIVPNSFTMTLGKGTKKMMVATFGSALTTMFADNLSDAIGKWTFKLFAYDDLMEFMNTIHALKNANTLEMTPVGSDITYVLTNAAIVNEPTIPLSQDEQITYEFEGDQTTFS